MPKYKTFIYSSSPTILSSFITSISSLHSLFISLPFSLKLTFFSLIFSTAIQIFPSLFLLTLSWPAKKLASYVLHGLATLIKFFLIKSEGVQVGVSWRILVLLNSNTTLIFLTNILLKLLFSNFVTHPLKWLQLDSNPEPLSS